MKKVFIFVGLVGLTACAGMNKNTVSYQQSQYDSQVYYTIAGQGPTKQAAAEDARAKMLQNIVQNVPDVQTVAQLNDVLANAKTGPVWRDKSRKEPKNYFALAVLKRKTAQKVLEAPADELDGRLSALAAQLQTNQEKFAGLRAAFAMQPLLVQRNTLQDLYRFLSADHAGYQTNRFEEYKNAYHTRLAAVKVAAEIRGEENAILLSQVVQAVNRLGLSVVEPNDENAALAVRVDAQVDAYRSDRIKGLEWADTSAAVSLRDLETNSTFAQFTVHDRAGTGRRTDSVRKSMEGVGRKAADEMAVRLMDYLKTK